MRYEEIEDGQRVVPRKHGYKMVCCDCGLVHRITFGHIACGRGRQVVFWATRDKRATAAVRRAMRKATQ